MPPFFSRQIGRKPYLEVLSRFGLWHDFLSNNMQTTISAFKLVKNMSVNPKSLREFHECHAKPNSICFYNNIKDNDNKGNLCQDLLTIDNTASDLKVHALHYANELLVRVRLSFQKLLQTRSTCRNNTKKLFRKRVMTRTRGR